MTHPTLVLDELVSQVAKRTVEGHHDARVEPGRTASRRIWLRQGKAA